MKVQGLLVWVSMDAALGYSFNYGNEYSPNRQYSVGLANDMVPLDASMWANVPLLSAAPVSFPNLPSGCRCLNEVQTSSTCTSFVCHETCNLNIGQCDEFCCSDPDCTAEEVESFQNIGKCLPDGSSDRITQCTDTSTLERVNEKYNMYVEQDDALSSLVCVSVNNNPYEGEFYQPQSGLINNVALLDTTQNRNSDSFRPGSFESDEVSRTGATVSGYLPNNNIGAALLKSNRLERVWGGYLSLPSQGPDGQCVSTNFVKFGDFVQTNGCILQLDQGIQSGCQDPWGPLSTTLFGDALRVAKLPTSSLTTSSGWVSVTVGAIYKQDPVTGETALVGGSNTPPVTEPSAAPTSAPSNAPSGAPTSSPTGASNGRRTQSTTLNHTVFESSSNTCKDAVVGVKYVIYHNLKGEISQVVVDLTLSDLTASAPSEKVVLAQHFRTEFINTDVNQEASQNQPHRVVSGNPGYIQGLPVQAGNITTMDSGLETAKSAVMYSLNGLSIPSAGGPRGECLSGGSADWFSKLSTEQLSTTPVMFGLDTTSSCTVQLSYTDFVQNMSTWCTDFSSLPIFDIPYQVLGIYGNANPYHSWEWVNLVKTKTNLLTTKPSPTPGELTCQNVVDHLDIEILWTKSGETSNPQPMILAARMILGQSDWAWRKTPSTTAKQTFTFTHTVTFLEHELDPSDTFDYKPEEPPLIPSIPSDVFYPFDIFSAAPTTAAVNQLVLIGLLLFIIHQLQE